MLHSQPDATSSGQFSGELNPFPSWQLKTEITEDDTEQRNSGASPDLISKKEDVKTHSSNSSSSEIEMINSESIDNSGEETH